MTVEELIIYGKKYVHKDFANMLLADLLNINSLELVMHLNDLVPVETVDIYKNKINLLKQNKPIQYVIGNVDFYGNKFIVNENVLIPRFETEELVENTLMYIDKLFDKKNLKVIDLGTGSGCIGLTLKSKNNNLDVTLLDISEQALKIAKLNKDNLNLDVKIIKNDMLEGLTEKYDVIISNPPYIKTDEEIEDIVKNNEPDIALYGGIDGIDFYEKILKKAKDNLNEKFLIAFEIGDTQQELIKELVNKYLPNKTVICKKDMQNRDRMIFIY